MSDPATDDAPDRPQPRASQAPPVAPAALAAPERPRPFLGSTAVRLGAVALVVALIGGAVASINLEPDLSHLDVTVFSGSEKGNYRHVVDEIAAYAKQRNGRVKNVLTLGTLDNLARLQAGADDDETRFALVQDGVEFPTGSTLEVVARLTSGEAVFFVAKADVAASMRGFADLVGKRIGIGPEASGTASLVRQIFALRGFEALDAKLANHPFEEQSRLVAEGALDVAVFVLHEDAELIREAVRDHGLGIIALEEVEAVAHAIGPVRVGRVVAGQYDAIRRLPPANTLLLKLDTLVLSDGSASHSEVVSLLTLLGERFPGFVELNREIPNTTGLQQTSAARRFFEDGGPAIMDEYAPWLVDLIPLSNLVHFAMVISVLFNLMGTGNRFCLWRIDVARVELESRLYELFGRVVTPAEVSGLRPEEAHRVPGWSQRLETLIRDLDALNERSRRQSVGVLVPMGGEMSYRYQETLVGGWVAALRRYREALNTAQS